MTCTSQVRLQVDQAEACLYRDRHVMRCILYYLVESRRTQQNIAVPWWKAGVELRAAASHDCLQSLTIGIGQHRRHFLLAARCRYDIRLHSGHDVAFRRQLYSTVYQGAKRLL